MDQINNRKKILIENNECFFREWGDETLPVIFCLPGWPTSSLCFEPLAQLLKNKFRVISLDMPGWADINTFSNDTSINYFIKYVEKIIKGFNFKKYFLLGYSYGGMIAQGLIKLKKANPEKLILLSTLSNGEKILKSKYLSIGPLLKLGLKLQNLKFLYPLVKKFALLYELKLINSKKTLYKNNIILDKLINETKKGDVKLIIDSLNSTSKIKLLSNRLKSVDLLVIYADGDLPFVIEDSIIISRLINKEPVVVPNASHKHGFFEPQKSAPYIIDFLSS